MENLDRWLPRVRSDVQLRLFCLPFAGGDSRVFHAWQDELPAWVEVCPLELPGRGALEALPLMRDPVQLVDALVAALTPVLDRPFALFGHSMGALLAFEIARVLRRQGGPSCSLLLASAHRAPQLPRTEPCIHDVSEPEFLDGLRRLEGTPPQVLESAELMALRGPLLRADFTICETYAYTHEPPLACPIVALGGLRDRSVGRQALEAWRAQTEASFVLRMFPGDHFFVRSARELLLSEIARELRPYRNLRRA